MRLDALQLENFRNYAAITTNFDPGVNLLMGDNAQGKTNLLEAITYLSTGHAFRTRKEAELLRFGAPFAALDAAAFSGGRAQTLRAVLFAGRQRRQLFVNGVKQKTGAALPDVLRTVLFCPEDLLVLKTGAAARRRMVDAALCQLRPGYDKALTEYHKLLEHKGRILKDYHENPALLDTLPDFDERMARVGAIVISYRARYLASLARETARFHGDFSGGKEALTLTYQTVSTVNDPMAGSAAVYDALRAHQMRHHQAELASGMCLSGPHKDDFDVRLDGISLKSYGSQGQTRTAAISLKLAEREILRADTGEEPVLLLDDVLSELDAGRQDFVLNQIRTGQVFITCCEQDKLTDIGRVLTVVGGEIRG
ncbi:MAG: DNA replication/repair protein RecF [Oscillospiraceae bacterium]|nr:DNA replication/repair protein RecF [Oscillospiraceae bacterium]